MHHAVLYDFEITNLFYLVQRFLLSLICVTFKKSAFKFRDVSVDSLKALSILEEFLFSHVFVLYDYFFLAVSCVEVGFPSLKWPNGHALCGNCKLGLAFYSIAYISAMSNRCASTADMYYCLSKGSRCQIS